MFTMETTNPTHFQLGIQITHYADILCYCTGSHVIGSVIVLYTSHMLSSNNSWKEIFSCFVAFVNGENCTNELY